MELVLYQYWRSSSSWRVRFALAHKGLAYESRAVNLLDGAQTSEEHLARSPMGTVPCLLIDGRALTESIAIVEHLDVVAPSPALLPREPWARARVRQLAEVVNSGVQPLQNLAVLRRHSGDTAEQKAWARHWIERGLGAYEALLEAVARELGGGRFSVGDELTMADVFLVPQVYSARRFGVDVARFPRTMAAHDRAAALEAAVASSPERSPGAPPGA